MKGLITQSLAVVSDKHSRYNLYQNSYRDQSGVVLAISLIILLLLTIIGLSATQTTALEEKMAGNLRDKSLAFQAAESALRVEEDCITKGVTLGITCSISSVVGDSVILKDIFWLNKPEAKTNIPNMPAPLYDIQKLESICLSMILPCPSEDEVQPYKFTVRANGGGSNTVVILQSITPLPSG
jgi:type IV pilus assembly protein PilX